MELTAGKTAVVTGAAGGIGLAMAERFASSGLNIVLADIDEAALAAAANTVSAHGVDTLTVRTDVSIEADVQALAAAAVERFGSVQVVCNNAGVASRSDPWMGPLSAWEWVMGVNFWGVVHGSRTFLPIMAMQGEGHIVNTASIAGVFPGFSPAYDASKHAVVAITEDLYNVTKSMGMPIGVSVLCPGWVRTGILDAERNWPSERGAKPEASIGAEFVEPHLRRAIDEGATPAAVADLVADAVVADRFWVFPQRDFLELAIARWHSIAEGQNPDPNVKVPGLPSPEELMAQVAALMAGDQ